MAFVVPTLFEIICLALIAASFLFQLWFLFRRVYHLIGKNNANLLETSFTPPVSVIVCAKNEADNLKKFLPAVLAQNYPEYQVIVVNDSSEDDSEMTLAQIKSKYPHLYFTTIPYDRNFKHGKKLAISVGVKAAAHNYLVFTDADCLPASENWLKNMVCGFAPAGKEIVLGFGGYMKQKGFINFLTRYDTFFIAMQYMGFALSGKPYMGVGRNLAYKKELFVKNNGMKNHVAILSGDDDLFVKETSTCKNVSVVNILEAHTYSLPPKTMREWLTQKARHLSTAGYYRNSIKYELFFEPFSREILWLTALIMIIFNNFAAATGGVLVINLVVKIIIWQKIAKLLNQGKLFWGVLLFDFIHPWLLLWAFFVNKLGRNKKRWK
ncbi:MAG: glycosyltransferase [Cytophagaceae bacterium]|jgi:cellulose synthase/poly-beta-1,6-N-acetylglucosamine synthase-like glycosyltransferase|nr:glycosyltransferase [Cytophagaceae bacterium]